MCLMFYLVTAGQFLPPSCVWRGEDSDMCGPSHGVAVKTTRRGEQLIAVLVVKADATSFSLIDLLLEMQLSQVGRLELLLAGFSERCFLVKSAKYSRY